MRRRSILLPVLSATVLALGLPTVQAQDSASAQREPQWSLIMVTKIKPEFRTEYEAYTKQISAAYRKAEVPSRVVLQPVMGDLSEYVSITPLQKFALMDGTGPLERAMGKDEADKLRKKGSMYTVSMHRLAALSIPVASIYSDSKEPPPLTMVSFVRLQPGKGPGYTEWLKSEYLPAMQKAEVKDLWISQTVFGGNSNERVIVRPMKALADIDAGPILTKALGREASMKLMSAGAAFAESIEQRIMRYRPDLSYRLGGMPQQTAKK